MKEKSILLSIFMLISIVASSQNFCFTPASTNNPELNNSSYLRATNDNYNYLLRIYFHVIRRSNGTGGQSSQKVSEAYHILNDDFNPHRIFFSWDGTIDYIDDDSRYNTPDISIYSVNNHQDGIDIYLYDDAASEGGRANGVGESSEFWISGRYWNPPFQSLITSHVISHEMGHVLFLWHTHHGTFNEGGNDNPCAELVNGSNSATCGDYVVDTPADPHLHFNVNQNTCQWNDSGRDANGHPYSPDTRLIMSYTDVGCMEYFSLKQGERMRNAIETLSYLQNTLILKFIKPSLSGPSSIYNEATYTVENLPVGSSVQWSSSSNCLRLISGQGTATATFKAIFNTSAVITATISGPTSTSLSTGTITANASYNSDISFDVWNNSSGGYIGNTATGTSGLCPNTTYHFSLVNNSGCALSDLEWTVSPAWTIYYTQNNMISINTNQAAGGWISLKARTCCGTSGTVCSATLGPSSDCSNYRFSLSPNPATDEVTLQLMETDEVSGLSVLSTDRSAYEIQLWSGMTMLRSFRTDEPTFQIPMAGLPAGLYFVRVVKDGQTYTQKLIKK